MARAGVLALVVGLLLLFGAGAWWVTSVLMRPPAAPEAPEPTEAVDPEPVAAAEGVLTPEALDELLATAQDAVRAGDMALARRVLNDAVAGRPGDQDLRAAFGELLVGIGEPEAAYEQYAAALAVGEPTAPLEFGAGLASNIAGQVERAAVHFDNAQRLDPTVPGYAIYLANARLAQGDLEGASAALVRATVLQPDNADAWGLLAEVALRQNRAALARQHAEKARTLEPEVAAWRVLEARAMKRDGDAEGALLVLEGVTGDERYAASVLRVRGECLGFLGRAGDAAELYLEAVMARPDDAEVLFDAAVWQERVGQAANATRLAERAAELGHEPAQRWLERRGG